MKAAKYIIQLSLTFIVLLFHSQSSADVPYYPHYDNPFLIGVEGLFSTELVNKVNAGFLFWTGGAIIKPLTDKNIGYGFETAVEIRKYLFKSMKGKGLFFGGYFGYAFMKTPRVYRENERMIKTHGITPGVKIGYKYLPLKHSKNLLSFRPGIEPYFSVGYSIYNEDNEWNSIFFPHLTLSLRLLGTLRINPK
jgi:hypothetical protein